MVVLSAGEEACTTRTVMEKKKSGFDKLRNWRHHLSSFWFVVGHDLAIHSISLNIQMECGNKIWIFHYNTTLCNFFFICQVANATKCFVFMCLSIF